MAETEERQERPILDTREPELAEAERQRLQQAYNQSQHYKQVMPLDTRAFCFLGAGLVLLMLAETVGIGGWIFVPVYVGVAIVYIAGSLHLFKKLMT